MIEYKGVSPNGGKMDTVKLSQIEGGDKLLRILELLPVIEEICEKYTQSKQKSQKRVSERHTNSNFIRSFRKME